MSRPRPWRSPGADRSTSRAMPASCARLARSRAGSRARRPPRKDKLMCGIVGYTGSRPALEILIQGLRRLEYRGYDSAGVAFFQSGRIEVRKSEGKLENVERILSEEALPPKPAVTCGIGHTRWATHGKP